MKKYNIIARGRTAEIYDWDEKRILKLYKKFFSQKTAQREFNIVRELAQKGLPVPAVDEIISFRGRWGIILERVTGPTMLEKLFSQPGEITREAVRLAEFHKAFQIEVDVPLPGFKSLIKESVFRVKEIKKKTREKLLEALEELPDGSKLCHGDFHPDNIIMGKDKVIVIDWLTAARGHPLADVARTSIIFKFGSVPEHRSESEIRGVKELRDRFYAQYLEQYLRITGEDQNLMEKWEIPLAAARLEESLPSEEKKALLDVLEGS